MLKIREYFDSIEPEVIDEWPDDFDQDEIEDLNAGAIVWRDDGATAYYLEDEDDN